MKMDDDQDVSPAVVQKYLTVVDLTSGKGVETTDPCGMLVALAERLRGMVQAFGNHDALELQTWRASTLTTSEIYAW